MDLSKLKPAKGYKKIQKEKDVEKVLVKVLLPVEVKMALCQEVDLNDIAGLKVDKCLCKDVFQNLVFLIKDLRKYLK